MASRGSARGTSWATTFLSASPPRLWRRRTWCFAPTPTTGTGPTAPKTAGGAGSRSDRALAFAADDLVELVAVPVDELLNVLGPDLDGEREVLHEALELLGADAL